MIFQAAIGNLSDKTSVLVTRSDIRLVALTYNEKNRMDTILMVDRCCHLPPVIVTRRTPFGHQPGSVVAILSELPTGMRHPILRARACLRYQGECQIRSRSGHIVLPLVEVQPHLLPLIVLPQYQITARLRPFIDLAVMINTIRTISIGTMSRRRPGVCQIQVLTRFKDPTARIRIQDGNRS